MIERRNVQLQDERRPHVLPDHEVEVDDDGMIRELVYDGRAWRFHHQNLMRDDRGETEKWLVFVPVPGDLA